MLDRQRSRGPDDRGIWASGHVALGLDRLSILDLSSHGHQPFVSPYTGSVIAYNGEVYNWRELRRELEREGVQCRSDCDTEVVLHALDRWGPEQAVARFNGMFSFAWFDPQSQSVWLARDRSGIKPLYLAQTPQAVVFASEAKALFAHPAVSCQPDAHSLTTLLYMGRLAGDWTGFVGVRSLLPGTLMRIDRNGLDSQTWFDLERDIDVQRIVKSRDEPFEKQVATMRELLEQSVQLHLQSDAPLAVMCSGGLDSSLTSALARRHRPDLVGFVAEVEDAPVNEAAKAQQVADHLGFRLHRVPISYEEYPALWAKAAWHNDDPIYFYQNPMTLKVSQAVSEQGYKVLVTGEGADELFGGYPWQMNAGNLWQARQWHGKVLPNVAPLRILGRLFRSLAPFDREALARYPFQDRTGLGREPPGAELVIDDGIRRQLARNLFERLAPLKNLGERAFLAKGFDDFYHHLRVLLSSNDKMTMATSVEMRVPFLENRLIDFGLHLAPKAKLHRSNRKRIVKCVAKGLLPDNIINALKVGFPIPDRFWTGYESILDEGLVPELFKWGSRQKENRQQIIRNNPILGQRLVSIELWAQLHCNGKSPAQLEESLRRAKGR